jgi:predicted kinase
LTRPSLVIISGPPASGKTTLARPLARALGMPLLSKNAIKERIADALGPVAMDHSGSIGLAAVFTLVDTAGELLDAGQSVVIESFFHHGKAERDLAPLGSMANAVLVHCTANDDTLLHRYTERIDTPGRHAIHRDSRRVNDLHAYLENATADPLDLSIPRLVIDTTSTFPDSDKVAEHVRSLLAGHPDRRHERIL